MPKPARAPALAAYLDDYLARTATLARALPLPIIQTIVKSIVCAWERDRFVFVMGNGGSAATASHLANDLGKGGITGFRRRFKVLALADNVPLLTAWANDTSYANVFAEQLSNFCGAGDVAIGISGSGNSPNVLAAMQLARERRAVTIGLTGFDGGELRALVDHCLVVPSNDMQHVEDMHMVVAHLIYSAIRDQYVEASHARSAIGAAP
jgi:D-sedoheptulose 7-phosphate isomerase